MNATNVLERMRGIAGAARQQKDRQAAENAATWHKLILDVIDGKVNSPEDAIARCEACGRDVEELHADVELLVSGRTEAAYLAENRAEIAKRKPAHAAEIERLNKQIKEFNDRHNAEVHASDLERLSIYDLERQTAKDAASLEETKRNLAERGIADLLN